MHHRLESSRYRLLFEHVPSPMWVYDVDTARILEVNEAAVAEYGYSRDEFAHMTLHDLRAPEDQGQLEATLRELDREGVCVHRARHRRRDGTLFDVETRGRPIPLDGCRARLVIATDISDRLAAERRSRHAEAEARRTSEMLQSLLDVAPEAIVVVDLEWRVTRWNRAAEQLFGWTAAEVIEKPLPNVPAEAREEFAARQRSLRAGQPVEPAEVIRVRKDGTRVAVLAASAPLRDASGSPSAYIAVLTDLTARKALEEQLRQSQKMEAVGRLAAGVAHDFNNILTVITSYSEMLRADVRDAIDDHVASEIEEIIAAAGRASALTRQLLAFGRKQPARPRPIDVSDTLAALDPMLRKLVPENVRFETVLRRGTGHVLADPTQLEQVALNLTINAVDAMPAGGALLVETSNVYLHEQHADKRGAVAPGEYVILAVTDTGIGMDATTAARIFEPFFTTKELGHGTGLGLSTVYGIVSQLGGSVRVRSELGKGATFEVYLPIMQDLAPPSDDEQSSAHAGSGAVLLLEEEESVRRAISRMLDRLGYTVLEASGGAAALALVRSHVGGIDAVVLDLTMPGVDGRRLAADLTAIHPRAHVVFTAAFTDDSVLRRGLVDASHSFLQKPFTIAQLGAALGGPVPA